MLGNFKALFLVASSIFVFFLPISIAGMELGAFLIILLGLIFYFYSLYYAPENLKLFRLPDKPLVLALLLMFIAIIVTGLLNTSSLKDFLGQFFELRYLIFSYFLFVAFQLLDDKSVKWLFGVLLFQLFITSCFGMWQYDSHIVVEGSSFVEGFSRPFRIRGFFSNPMTYAYSMGIFIVLLLGKNILSTRSFGELAVLGLLSVNLALTFTRGAWLAFGVCVMFVGFKLPIKKTLVLGGGVFVGLLAAVKLNPILLTRLTNIFAKESSSREIRLELWNAAYNLASENVFFGAGMRSLNKMLPAWYESVGTKYNFIGHAHNNFLEVLVGQGIFGLFAYLFFFSRLGWLSYKGINFKNETNMQGRAIYPLGVGTFFAIVFFHIGGMTESTILDYEVLYALSLCIAWSLVFIKTRVMVESHP